MDGWTEEMTNESPPVFYRTSFPSGPLPCFLSLHTITITITQSRETGIVDHILPLGDLLFVHLIVRSSFHLKSDLPSLKPGLSGFKSGLSGIISGLSGIKSDISGLKSGLSALKSGL